MISSWAIENNVVYYWGILVTYMSMIVIVSWAIENKLGYMRSIIVGPIL